MEYLLGLLFITGLTSPLGLMYGGIDEAGVNGGVGFPGIGLCWYECIDLLPPEPPLFIPDVFEDDVEFSPKLDDVGGTTPGPLLPVGGYW